MSAALRVILAAVLSLVLPSHATLSYEHRISTLSRLKVTGMAIAATICMCALAANALSSHLLRFGMVGVVTSSLDKVPHSTGI